MLYEVITAKRRELLGERTDAHGGHLFLGGAGLLLRARFRLFLDRFLFTRPQNVV